MIKNLFEILDILPVIIENGTQSICITDNKRRIIYVNKAFTRFFGYTYDDVKSKTPKILSSGSTPKETYDDLNRKLKTEGYWSGILINRTRGGIKIETNSSITRIESFSKVYYYCLAHSSINDMHLDDQTLLDVYGRLDTATSSADIGVWDWNIATGDLTVNKRCAKIIGYSLKELQPINIKTWECFVHPDDLKTAKVEIGKCARGEQKSYDVCVRMKHRDGHWIWVLDRGEIVEFDEQDKPIRMCGFHSDFTDRIKLHEQMEYRVRLEELLCSITSSLIDVNPKNLNEKLDSCLKRIGIFTCIDRASLFIFKDNGQVIDNTNEWCNDGIDSCSDKLMNLSTPSFPWWTSKQKVLESIYIEDVKQMPAAAKIERDLLESKAVKSLLAVPVHAEEALIGYIGFDSVRRIKKWNDSDIHILESIGRAVALALISVQAYEKLIVAKEEVMSRVIPV